MLQCMVHAADAVHRADAAVHGAASAGVTVLLQQVATLLLSHGESLQGKPSVVANA